MQDRFKFRTWNPDIKTFTYWGWLKNGEYKNMCSCRDISKDELLEKYTQQCTGLKDKNGKLIYEGDIVKFYNEFFQTMKIVWDNDELDFKAIGLKKSVECYGQDFSYLGGIEKEDSLEVIGNIYENPELLGVGNER